MIRFGKFLCVNKAKYLVGYYVLDNDRCNMTTSFKVIERFLHRPFNLVTLSLGPETGGLRHVIGDIMETLTFPVYLLLRN